MPCVKIPELSYGEFSRKLDPKVWSQRVPFLGTLILTYRCNQRCVHCYCNLPADDEKVKERELTYREICRILDEIADAGCLWLLMTGGEPLLREDFWDVYVYARKKGIFVEVFTNGTLVTPEAAKRFAELPPRGIEVSIYGATAQTHDRITGVEGSFGRTQAGIRHLLDQNLPLALKTVLMTLNKHELPEMEQYALQLRLAASFVYDSYVTARLDEAPNGCKLRLSPEEIVDLDIADTKRLTEYKAIYEAFGKLPRKELLLCGAGIYSFSVDPYGRLQPCDSFIAHAYDLKNGSFREGWQEAMPGFRKEMEGNLNRDCLECDVIPLCENCSGYALLECRRQGMIVKDLCEKAHLRYEAISGLSRPRELRQGSCV